jgi:hypothetical protein
MSAKNSEVEAAPTPEAEKVQERKSGAPGVHVKTNLTAGTWIKGGITATDDWEAPPA